jgi:hypothetical protein
MHPVLRLSCCAIAVCLCLQVLYSEPIPNGDSAGIVLDALTEGTIPNVADVSGLSTTVAVPLQCNHVVHAPYAMHNAL